MHGDGSGSAHSSRAKRTAVPLDVNGAAATVVWVVVVWGVVVVEVAVQRRGGRGARRKMRSGSRRRFWERRLRGNN